MNNKHISILLRDILLESWVTKRYLESSIVSVYEELNQYQKAKVATWPTATPEALAGADHYFGVGVEEREEALGEPDAKSVAHKAIQAHLGISISIADYRAGYIDGRRIGGILASGYNRKGWKANKELEALFAADMTRKAEIKPSEFTVLTTRSPNGVAGQSTGTHWDSCKNIDHGLYRKKLPGEVAHGTVVSYLLDADREEIARATFHPYVSEAGDRTYRQDSMYGANHAGFIAHYTSTLAELSKNEKPNTKYYMHPAVYNNSRKTVTDQKIHSGISDNELSHMANNSMDPDIASQAREAREARHMYSLSQEDAEASIRKGNEHSNQFVNSIVSKSKNHDFVYHIANNHGDKAVRWDAANRYHDVATKEQILAAETSIRKGNEHSNEFVRHIALKSNNHDFLHHVANNYRNKHVRDAAAMRYTDVATKEHILAAETSILDGKKHSNEFVNYLASASRNHDFLHHVATNHDDVDVRRSAANRYVDVATTEQILAAETSIRKGNEHSKPFVDRIVSKSKNHDFLYHVANNHGDADVRWHAAYRYPAVATKEQILAAETSILDGKKHSNQFVDRIVSNSENHDFLHHVANNHGDANVRWNAANRYHDVATKEQILAADTSIRAGNKHSDEFTSAISLELNKNISRK